MLALATRFDHANELSEYQHEFVDLFGVIFAVGRIDETLGRLLVLHGLENLVARSLLTVLADERDALAEYLVEVELLLAEELDGRCL